jgi:hypothetical protein
MATKYGVPYEKMGRWVVRHGKGPTGLTWLAAQNAEQARLEVASRRAPLPAQPIPRTPGTDAIDTWLSTRPLPEESDESVFTPSGRVETPVKLSESISLDSLPAPKLNSDDRIQFHGMLAGIVSRANVLVIGASVKMFGRQPEEPSEKDTELLDRAWAMQLEIWFADTSIPPWVLICAASGSLGIGMWAGGTPILKKGQGLASVPQGPPKKEGES